MAPNTVTIPKTEYDQLLADAAFAAANGDFDFFFRQLAPRPEIGGLPPDESGAEDFNHLFVQLSGTAESARAAR